MIIIGPLWFLNLLLVGLNFLMISFFSFTYKPVTCDVSFKNIVTSEITLPQSVLPSLENIIDKDLFNTRPPVTPDTPIFVFEPKNLVSLINVPPLPEAIPLGTVPYYEQEVLPPLQIILRGTIISDNPLHNKVFIENLRTKEEKEYGVGDIIDDSQIVFIGKSEVTLIRSNGQEEMIYLNKLLKIEEEAINKIGWTQVISFKENLRFINTRLFKLKIKSLGWFIDELGLITVFKNNIPVGCVVHGAGNDSLGLALGFQNNDIIVAINDIEINSVASRIAIYEFIMKNKNSKDFTIKVSVLRNEEMVDLLFKLLEENVGFTKHVGILNIKHKTEAEIQEDIEKKNHKTDEKMPLVYTEFTNVSQNEGIN